VHYCYVWLGGLQEISEFTDKYFAEVFEHDPSLPYESELLES
jgi:hypothetical protein